MPSDLPLPRGPLCGLPVFLRVGHGRSNTQAAAGPQLHHRRRGRRPVQGLPVQQIRGRRASTEYVIVGKLRAHLCIG
jgi:hypothetical protein